MKLNGLIAAVHTPMHDDFTVDYDRVPAQAEHLAKGGASGAFVTGTTGESHSLTTEERLRMFDAWGRAAHRNGLKFIAHVGHNNLPDNQDKIEDFLNFNFPGPGEWNDRSNCCLSSRICQYDP